MQRVYRFLVDENLARLTRWLRFYGFDSVLARGWTDPEVSARAAMDQRVLVTRDTDLVSRHVEESIWIRSDDLRDQLVQVLKVTGVPATQAWFSRCVECNEKLRRLSESEVHALESIPSFIKAKDRGACWGCDLCGRAYWKGSHFDRTQQFLESVSLEAVAGVNAEANTEVPREVHDDEAEL